MLWKTKETKHSIEIFVNTWHSSWMYSNMNYEYISVGISNSGTTYCRNWVLFWPINIIKFISKLFRILFVFSKFFILSGYRDILARDSEQSCIPVKFSKFWTFSQFIFRLLQAIHQPLVLEWQCQFILEAFCDFYHVLSSMTLWHTVKWGQIRLTSLSFLSNYNTLLYTLPFSHPLQSSTML